MFSNIKFNSVMRPLYYKLFEKKFQFSSNPAYAAQQNRLKITCIQTVKMQGTSFVRTTQNYWISAFLVQAQEIYRKIPNISPWAYNFQRPFLVGL